ncbi:MAG: hypothetical protein HQ518_00105, partial [Rhodopirellula sp.]|nr:hypothetical protein [Rhodopirellula sp.]
MELLEKRELLAADLMATHFNVLNDHVQSGVAEIEVSFRNQGDVAADAFEAHIVWSPNGVYGDSDDALVQASVMTVESIAAGATRTQRVDVPLDRAALNAHANAADPGGRATGTISTDVSYLFLVIDTQNVVAESDESNNFDSGRLLDIEDITYFPWDKDGNGTVTPTEAVGTIQALNTGAASSDYDGSGLVTPTEAIGTIQRLGYKRNDGPYLVSPLADRQTTEDTVDQTIDLSDVFAIIDDSELTLTVSTSNPSLVAAGVNNKTLTLAYGANEAGTSDITVTATKSNGLSVSDTFRVTVDAVNDPPVVVNPPGIITLTNGMPTRTIDLNSVFNDPEGSALSYQVVSFDAGLLTKSLSGSQLTLTGLEQKTGNTTVVIEATDVIGDTARVTIETIVDRASLPPLDSVLYAMASDQVVEFHGQNTFVLATDFDELSRVSVLSGNSTVINANDVEIVPLGNGRFRVVVRHRTDEFGLTILQFSVQDIVFADVATVVLPDPENIPTELGDTRYSYSEGITDDGTYELTRTFNDRFLAAQLENGSITPETLFNLVRPTTAKDLYAVHVVDGASATLTREVAQSSNSLARQSVNSSGDFSFSSSLNNPVYTGQVSYSVIVPVGDDLKIKQKLETPLGNPFLDNLGKEFWEGADLSKPANVINVAANTVAAIGFGSALILGAPVTLTVAAGIAFGAPILGTLLNANARTQFELDPGKFDNERELANYLNTVDVGVAIVGTAAGVGGSAAAALGLIDDVAVAGLTGYKAFVASVTNSTTYKFVDLQTSFANFVATGNSLDGNLDAAQGSAQTAEKRQELQTLFENVTFSSDRQVTEAKSVLPMVKAKSGDDSESMFSNEDVNRHEQAVALITEAGERLIEAKEAIADDTIDNSLPEIPPDAIPDDNTDERTNEATGENGDDQERITEAIKKIYDDQNPDLTSAVSVGKKLYDITKSVQAIVGQVGQLFETASGDEGDYTDNDGKTYNLNVAQSGDKERQGTPDRDVINTSYLNDVVYAFAGDDRINSLDGDD